MLRTHHPAAPLVANRMVERSGHTRWALVLERQLNLYLLAARTAGGCTRGDDGIQT